ncbi:MAG: TIR domain-containing protein [Nitrospira sp.]
MPSIFLSYSREDLPFIQQLDARLSEHPELSVWRDQEKIYGGQKWPKVLGEAIADQDLFLLAWSKNAASSHFVELEWNTAIALKRTIIPCLLDDTPLAPSLRAFHGYRLDDVTGLIKSLQVTPPTDAQRRDPVLNSLNGVTSTEEEDVLSQAKAIFSREGLRESVLRGRVFFIENNDELTSAPGLNVTLLQTAKRTSTDSDGLFILPLPDGFQPGAKVDIGIKQDGWVIYSPIDGEITIPALDSELVKIRLVKKSSPKLWSNERITKFIEDTAKQAKEQVRTYGKPEDIDFSRYIKDWAVRYGFTAQQAKQEIDMWVTDAEHHDDPYQLGLAAYAKKNFGLAGKHFEESASLKLKRLQDAEKSARSLKEEVIRDYRLAGDARYNQYEFAPALTCYQQAIQLTAREKSPHLWAAILGDIGGTHRELGIRTDGDHIHRHLADAVAAYHTALTVYTKEECPQQWALMQNNLGAVLWAQGTRTTGEAGTRLLALAVDAYKAALTVRTKKSLPRDWALTQNNLGAVLWAQGTRTAGGAGTRLLALAIDAYKAALTVRTKKSLPQDWAATQNKLGLVLWDQGKRTAGPESMHLLQTAETAYRDALTVRTKEMLPQDWAATQNNLGLVLWSQGQRATGTESMRLLQAAEAVHRKALTVRTKEELPQDWALTQNNLGAVLWDQGQRAAGTESIRLLQAAEAAYRDALTIYTKSQLPQDWARTQMNLGNVLSDHGRRVAGAESLRLLQAAEVAYRNALTVYTQSQLPQDWARTQMNLGLVLWSQERQATGTESIRLLQAAEAAYRDALTIYTKSQLPQDWALTQNNLGGVLSEQGTRTDGESGIQMLAKAIDAFTAALTVYTKDQFPQRWTESSANLAETLFVSGRFDEAKEQLTPMFQYPELDSQIRVVLLAIEVANFVALGPSENVLHSFDTLQQTIDKQIPDFSLNWGFSSIKQCVAQNHVFARHRSWLLSFIEHLENKQRDEMQTAVKTARTEFLKTSKP